jgi:uncharacterized protein YndB with AHSA1/START domain
MSAMTDVAITRIFDAPRETVYRAFADPDRRSKWSGPGVRATVVEVVENELLVGEESSGDAVVRTRMEFHDQGDGRSRLVLTQGPCRPGIEAEAREAWSSSFARLDKFLSRARR